MIGNNFVYIVIHILNIHIFREITMCVGCKLQLFCGQCSLLRAQALVCERALN